MSPEGLTPFFLTSGQFIWSRFRHCVVSVLLSLALLSCAISPPPVARSISALPALHLQDRDISVAEVSGRAPTPALLALDEEMHDFVQRYTAGVRNSRQRLMLLHQAVTGRATLGLDYDPLADGTARQVFHRRSANCLSYANLFVALARDAGLDARYQWLEVRPQWTRQGERVMVRLHVNVLVVLPNKQQYMVDIDPLPSRDIAGSQPISDAGAQALYHNNIAMDALARDDLEQAWVHSVRALQLSPLEAHLWVNLGAIYRMAGQHRAAENSYLYALQLNPWDRSAMNNLVVLYGIEQRAEDRAYWQQRVARYRDANPYYHAWMGDTAAEAGNWQKALEHYEDALDLLPQDSRLLYATGMIHYRLHQLRDASSYLKRAVKTATLHADAEAYRRQLDEVRARMLAES